jgi:hypothetical protein
MTPIHSRFYVRTDRKHSPDRPHKLGTPTGRARHSRAHIRPCVSQSPERYALSANASESSRAKLQPFRPACLSPFRLALYPPSVARCRARGRRRQHDARRFGAGVASGLSESRFFIDSRATRLHYVTSNRLNMPASLRLVTGRNARKSAPQVVMRMNSREGGRAHDGVAALPGLKAILEWIFDRGASRLFVVPDWAAGYRSNIRTP